MSHRDSHDVIVVGAGASGLAAATALHTAGRDTVTLEARDRIGGRLLSAPTSHPQRALDLGATWFWDGEERVRALAARTGIETFGQHLAGDTLLQETTGIRRLAGNLIDAPSHRFAGGSQTIATALAAALPRDTLPLQEIHDMSGPDGRPAALFGFAHARAVRPGFAEAVTAQLAQLFGPAAATPDVLHVQNWSAESWTSPSTVQRLADYSLFGHPLYQRPALDGRLHWASTETATDHAGHVEGALTAGERAGTVGAAAPGVSNSVPACASYDSTKKPNLLRRS
ncbi:FAD-dependent oxidoreductase [Streptomyces sp. NPDC102274]|uniref:FAD-dependent oxidoreductase n=1 Tax=Streptomyces sp. NPDC102274 TaxID=3366151 RepID=UPI00383030F3